MVVLVALGAVIGGVAVYFILQYKIVPNTTSPSSALNQAYDKAEKDQKQVLNIGDTFRIQGIDVVVTKAVRVVKEDEQSDYLVISLSFAANIECPLTGGAVCGNSASTFKLKDDRGYLYDRAGTLPIWSSLQITPLQERILRKGDKNKGDIVFSVPRNVTGLILEHYSPDLTDIERVSIEPEVLIVLPTPTSTPYLYFPGPL